MRLSAGTPKHPALLWHPERGLGLMVTQEQPGLKFTLESLQGGIRACFFQRLSPSMMLTGAGRGDKENWGHSNGGDPKSPSQSQDAEVLGSSPIPTWRYGWDPPS